MKVIVTGRNVNLTDSLRDTIESKLDKLEKYFNKEAEAQVTLSVEKERQIMEVTIPLSGSVLRAEEATTDMYMTIGRRMWGQRPGQLLFVFTLGPKSDGNHRAFYFVHNFYQSNFSSTQMNPLIPGYQQSYPHYPQKTPVFIHNPQSYPQAGDKR